MTTQQSTNSATDLPLLVAIWCAVSSKQQAEPDKISLESQEQQGRAFTEAIGGVVVRTCMIRGASHEANPRTVA